MSNKSYVSKRFSAIAESLTIFLLFLVFSLFYFVPNFEHLLAFGSMIACINDYQLESESLENLVYGKAICLSFMSLLPLCAYVFVNKYGNEIGSKRERRLNRLITMLLIGIDLYFIFYKGGTFRMMQKTTELVRTELFWLNFDHTNRFFKNVSGYYCMFLFPPFIQLASWYFIEKMDSKSRRKFGEINRVIWIPIILIICAFLYFVIVCLLSAIGLIAVSAFCFVCLAGTAGSVIKNSSPPSRGTHAGYDSNEGEIFHDGNGGYMYKDGRSYSGMIHACR